MAERRRGCGSAIEGSRSRGQIGDDSGARVDLDAEKLVGIDGETCVLESLLRLTQGSKGFQNFAFKALEVFKGDIKEIAGTAGRIEDAGVAQLAVEVLDDLNGGFGITFLLAIGDGCQGVGPIGAQWFNESGDDETLDVGARGVVGAEGVAFGRIESALEKGAEDRGLDISPVGVCGLYEECKLIAR